MKMAKGGSEDQLKIIAVVAFVVIAAAIFYFEYFDTSGPSTPTPTVSAPVAAPAAAASATAMSATTTIATTRPAGGPAAKPVGTTSAALDPTLHMDAMLVAESVEYSGTGRNIFSANSVPTVPIPNPIASARPKPSAIVATLAPPVPTGPPPPPPIELKFFGVEDGVNGKREAFLLHDDTVYTAAAGDVVLRRYKVIKIDPKSIDVEDMQNNNKQTLPLLVN